MKTIGTRVCSRAVVLCVVTWMGGAAAVAADGRTSPTARTAASKPATAPVSGTKQIVLTVERLAGDGTQASVVFAVKLTTVLAKHKVALPEALRRLAAPRPPVPKPTAAEMTRLYEATNKIMVVWAGSGVSASLRRDLLITIALHCPSSTARVQAAEYLARRALPDAEGRRIPDVSLAQAAQAIEAALGHALDTSSGALGSDSVPALRLARLLVLPRTLLAVKGMALDNPTKDALDKVLKDLAQQVATARTVVGQDKKANEALDGLADQIKRVGLQTGKYAKILAGISTLRPLVKRLFDAANKEDFAAAQKLLTKKTAARLAKEKTSLRAWIANSPNVKEVRFLLLGAIETIGPQYYVPIQILIVDANGKSRPDVWNAYLTKTDSGWRFGE